MWQKIIFLFSLCSLLFFLAAYVLNDIFKVWMLPLIYLSGMFGGIAFISFLFMLYDQQRNGNHSM